MEPLLNEVSSVYCPWNCLGIKEIVLPALNEKDVVEIPDNVKEDVRFHLVQDIKEALGLLLAKE